MAKPDNRANNAERLQDHIDDTVANLQEAEEYLEEHAEEISPEERTRIKKKNERRRESIEAFADEKKDEGEQ